MVRFLPDEYYSSTYKIDFKDYYNKGYRGILFDIDNTLVRHNEPATSRAIKLMEKLKAIGFKVCLVSNNKEPRVASFNKKMKVNYIYKAGSGRPDIHRHNRQRQPWNTHHPGQTYRHKS